MNVHNRASKSSWDSEDFGDISMVLKIFQVNLATMS